MDRPFSIRHLLVPALMAWAVLTPAAVGAVTETEEKASADTVAAGLEKIEDIASDSAAVIGKDGARAEELHAGIEPVWEKIEGTVKANDSAAYVALEDNFTLLKIAAKAADPAKASTASNNLSEAVKAYLAEHPGDPTSATAATSSGSRTAAAEESAGTPVPSASNLPRTGSVSGRLSALAGAALGIGGLALIGGARRRTHRAG